MEGLLIWFSLLSLLGGSAVNSTYLSCPQGDNEMNFDPTPKVFANSSPGLSFGNPGAKKFRFLNKTLKGFAYAANPFRVPQTSPT